MNSCFSTQAKEMLSEAVSLIFLIVIIGVSLSFFARVHWSFNLFDQFWSYYLLGAAIASFSYWFLKKMRMLVISLLVFFISFFILFSSYAKKDQNVLHSDFKIYYQNINSSNKSLDALVSGILKNNSDIATLAEVTPEAEFFLSKNLKSYVNHFSLSRDDNFGFLILSKEKFHVDEVFEKNGIPVYVKFHTEKKKIKIFLVHLPPPLWKEAFDIQKIALSRIENEVSAHHQDSILIIGDFNSTTSSRIYRDFYKKINFNYSSDHFIGNGTWPSLLPSILQLPIDHVLSNKIIETQVGPSFGSDHQSIMMGLRF